MLLLADFLNHTGFDVELVSLDLEGGDSTYFQLMDNLPERLEAILNRPTTIVVRDLLTKREEEVIADV